MSISGIDIKGRYVIVREDRMAQAYKDITWRTALANGGFGTSPTAMGRAVFVTDVRDGNDRRINRDDIDRLATVEEVEAALSFGGLVQS